MNIELLCKTNTPFVRHANVFHLPLLFFFFSFLAQQVMKTIEIANKKFKLMEYVIVIWIQIHFCVNTVQYTVWVSITNKTHCAGWIAGKKHRFKCSPLCAPIMTCKLRIFGLFDHSVQIWHLISSLSTWTIWQRKTSKIERKIEQINELCSRCCCCCSLRLNCTYVRSADSFNPLCSNYYVMSNCFENMYTAKFRN